jgi:hypothetical protein
MEAEEKCKEKTEQDRLLKDKHKQGDEKVTTAFFGVLFANATYLSENKSLL